MEKKTFLINMNVLNALNLINPALGKAYEGKGYNPFDDDFVLQNEYVQKLLDGIKNRKVVTTEDFLEQGNKKVQNNFQIALENVEYIETEIEKLQDKKKNHDFKNIIIYLKNRKELLLQAIKKLENVNANSLELYQDIVNLDSAYSEILKKSFFEHFNKNVAINQFINMANIVQIAKSKTSKEEEKIIKIQKQKTIKFEQSKKIVSKESKNEQDMEK